MAQLEDKHVLSVVRRVLPEDEIASTAHELGLVRRRRKLDVVAFIRALVLGFAGSSRRTLAGLRRGYELGTGQRLAPSSFYARFTPELAQLLGKLSANALAAIGDGAGRHSGAFASFREVLAIDSTLVRLHASLASTFPSVWTNHTPASVKLGALINVVGRRPTRLTICPGSRHDIHLLEPGRWMMRRLFVFDLGFFGASIFQRIDLHGGYFLTRMRKHGNPVVLRTWRGTNEPLVGRRLRYVLENTLSKVIDVEAEMVFQERLDVIKTRHASFRFVAVFHEETSTWHGYVTNARPTMLAAEHVSRSTPHDGRSSSSSAS